MITSALTPIISTFIACGFYTYRLANGGTKSFSGWLISYGVITFINSISSIIITANLLSHLSQQPTQTDIIVISLYPQIGWIMTLFFNAIIRWTQTNTVKWVVKNDLQQ